jgi:membrane-associated phospholipid phosphatase
VKQVGFSRLLAPALFISIALFIPPAYAQSDLGADPTQTPISEPESPISIPEVVAAPVDHSFNGLFSQMGRDFRSFPRKDNLMWLSLSAGLSLAAHRADGDVTRSLATSRRTEEVLEPGRTIGGAAVQFGGPFATYAVGRLMNKPAVTHIGSDLLRAQVLAQGITQGIKLISRRTRPDGTNLSFPSGHTAATFASAKVLQNHYGWRVGAPAYAVATYVALSRLSENRHYPSDVIFGAAVGLLSARTVTIGHGSFRFAVTPFASRDAAGIALVKIRL